MLPDVVVCGVLSASKYWITSAMLLGFVSGTSANHRYSSLVHERRNIFSVNADPERSVVPARGEMHWAAKSARGAKTPGVKVLPPPPGLIGPPPPPPPPPHAASRQSATPATPPRTAIPIELLLSGFPCGSCTTHAPSDATSGVSVTIQAVFSRGRKAAGSPRFPALRAARTRSSAGRQDRKSTRLN